MNALKVVHGFALISGSCNIFFGGLAPLFTSGVFIDNKWQESRIIAVSMKNMNYVPGGYTTIFLIHILFT